MEGHWRATCVTHRWRAIVQYYPVEVDLGSSMIVQAQKSSFIWGDCLDSVFMEYLPHFFTRNLIIYINGSRWIIAIEWYMIHHNGMNGWLRQKGTPCAMIMLWRAYGIDHEGPLKGHMCDTSMESYDSAVSIGSGFRIVHDRPGLEIEFHWGGGLSESSIYGISPSFLYQKLNYLH